jgi:hypothetical protein
MASTFIRNTTELRELVIRVDHQLSKMYARRAFIHLYVNKIQSYQKRPRNNNDRFAE